MSEAQEALDLDNEEPLEEGVQIPGWKKDEAAFLRHFGIPYADFGELILALSPDQQDKYEKTRRANEEAAILWAVHEGKSHGLLESADTGTLG